MSLRRRFCYAPGMNAKTPTRPARGIPWDAGIVTTAHNAARVLAVCAAAILLTGCDKCGDYFWIDGAAPHSCKDAPAAR